MFSPAGVIRTRSAVALVAVSRIPVQWNGRHPSDRSSTNGPRPIGSNAACSRAGWIRNPSGRVPSGAGSATSANRASPRRQTAVRPLCGGLPPEPRAGNSDSTKGTSTAPVGGHTVTSGSSPPVPDPTTPTAFRVHPDSPAPLECTVIPRLPSTTTRISRSAVRESNSGVSRVSSSTLSHPTRCAAHSASSTGTLSDTGPVPSARESRSHG